MRGYLAEELPRELAPRASKKRKKKDWLSYRFVGIDGEGMDVSERIPDSGDDRRGLRDGFESPVRRHLYTYLCATAEDGEVISDCYRDTGLTHDEICNVLLAVPSDCLCFGYMISYDITKWIEALPDEDKYRLLRPDTRQIYRCKDCHRTFAVGLKFCPHCLGHEFREGNDPIRWSGRQYDYFAGPFEVWGDRDPNNRKWRSHTKVWDVIRFFGTSFVQAITDWKVGTAEQHARIDAMKKKRGSFDVEKEEDIKGYCRQECELLAQMMRKVVEGHVDAGWELRAFYGAGSTGKAMLTANGVKAYKGPKIGSLDPALAIAIMSAFFGGRFEDSHVGVVRRPIWSKDIASAYPYAMVRLPCLACGSWRRIGPGKSLLREVAQAPLACCRFTVRSLPEKERRQMAWAPLPFRDESGSIAYPLNFSGWAWKPEAMQALLGWPDLVKIEEAWVYDQACDHKPFEFMPDVYRRRVAIGKEGPGLVLKLGANAGYGVTAQSIGDDPPFQEWVWAGNITSSCRAQALEVFRSAKDPWSILTVATDGICGTEDFAVPIPFETGTRGCRAPPTKEHPEGEIKQPLGGWESEAIPEGMFIAKPGMYWRLDLTDTKKMRARGIGRKELFDSKDRVISEFLRWDRKDFKFKVVVESRRFFGAKSTIYARSRCNKCNVSWPGTPERLCPRCGSLGVDFRAMRQTQVTDETRKDEGRVDVYGTWGVRAIDIRFDPFPKREREVGKGECSRLFVRDADGKMSSPYKGDKTPEALALIPEAEMLEEQPDCGVDVLDMDDLGDV